MYTSSLRSPCRKASHPVGGPSSQDLLHKTKEFELYSSWPPVRRFLHSPHHMSECNPWPQGGLYTDLSSLLESASRYTPICIQLHVYPLAESQVPTFHSSLGHASLQA